MATRPTLPFYCPSADLPAPLPTIAEILASNEYQFTLKFMGGTRVVRIGEHFIVKYGPLVRLQEGENMLFVQQNTSVKVPAVYALFHDEDTNFNFIIQEYIPGKDMRCWNEIGADRKEDVVGQLRAYFNELRSLPSPGYFGGVWRQGLLDGLFNFSRDEEPGNFDAANVKPCDTEDEFVDAMLASAQLVYKIRQPYFRFLQQTYKSVFRNHRPVFTHGDLHSENVRIREDGAVFLIDWETSGWYPSCWEFCLIMSAADMTCPKAGGWYASIPRFLDQYPSELGWMMHFRPWIQDGAV